MNPIDPIDTAILRRADYLTDGTGRVRLNAGMGDATGICDYPSNAVANIEFARRIVAFLHRNQQEDWLRKWAADCRKHGYKSANTWLRQRAGKHRASRELIARFYPDDLPLIAHSSDSIEVTAADCATHVLRIITETTPGPTAAFDAFQLASHYAKAWHVETGYEQAALLDHIEEAALCGLLKLQCEKFWARKLNRMASRYREHLRMALGHVGKRGQAYISGAGFNEWRQTQERQQAWIDAMQIRNEKTGDVIPLRTAFDAGLGNLSNRFAEMMIRAKGLQALAEERGWAALFVTWTCPSRFHVNKGKGWSGAGARQGQQYLVKLYARVRAKLDRDGMKRFGIRVAEAHKDGCPHWHMLFWCDPEDMAYLQEVLYAYALKDSPDEAGAKKHRCTFKEITPEEGDAVAYIVKYIDKNLGGNLSSPDKKDDKNGDKKDEEAETPAQKGAKRVRAWASKWGLRQFQFFGTEKVTVWRELYRMDEQTAAGHELTDAWQAVKDKNWADFQRGLAGRKVKTAYEVTEYGNAYAEATKKLVGLLVDGAEVITRSASWIIEKIPKAAPGGSAAPWTRRNKCTEGDIASEIRANSPPERIFETTGGNPQWAIP